MKETPICEDKKKLTFGRLVPIAVIATGFSLFFLLGISEHLSFAALKANRLTIMAWTDQNYPLAVAAFMGAYIVVVGLSLPGGVWLTLAGGFLFGTVETTAYVVFAATIGATIIFWAARYAFADFMRARAGPAIRKMEDGFRDNALSYLLVLRLVPIFPFWLVNLVPALIGMRLGTYMFGTFIGIIPGAFVFASVGSGLGSVFDSGGKPDLGIIFTPEVLLPVIGLAVLALIPVIYKKLKRSSV